MNGLKLISKTMIADNLEINHILYQKLSISVNDMLNNSIYQNLQINMNSESDNHLHTELTNALDLELNTKPIKLWNL